MFWGPSGGVRRTLTAKHRRLPALGFAHTIVAPAACGPGLRDGGGLPLPASGGYRFVFSRRRAAERIDATEPDLIESADPYRMAWACLDVARDRGIPALAFCHSNLPLVVGRRLGAKAEARARRYLAHLYERFDMVLAPSRAIVDALRSWDVPRVRLQPLGVDTRLFHPSRRDEAWRLQLLARLGRPLDSHVVVYAGRFAAEKNLALLAQAVEMLGPGWLLLLAGSGPRMPQGAHVHCLGTLDAPALARVLASCDAFVHPGDQETFGLAALEAMACGTRVVLSAREGLGELVAGLGCCTVDSVRASIWAEAIAEAVFAHDTRDVEAALARAREHDWSLVVLQMARRYARLIGQARRAGAVVSSGAAA